jgi:hypothetical protein
MLAQAAVAPEERERAEARENPGGDAPAVRIAYPGEQQIARWMDMLDQLVHARARIGRPQVLLGEHVPQVRMVFLGEALRGRRFDAHARLLRFPDRAPAGARHVGEQPILALGQIGDQRADRAMGVAMRAGVLRRELAVGDLEMKAAQLPEREPLHARQSFDARHAGREIEAHVGCRPAAERATQNGNAAPAEQDPIEVPDQFRRAVQFGDDDLAPGERSHEFQPVAPLRKGAVAERVQSVPVDLVEWRSVNREHAMDLNLGRPHGDCRRASGRGARTRARADRPPLRPLLP